MLKNAFEKTTEEIFKERADVLYRTGEALSDALHELASIGKRIDSYVETLTQKSEYGDYYAIAELKTEINSEIARYDRAREHAKLRYYYLIITREAMGLRRHTWVEEVYKIPPRKEPLGKPGE